jgi:copper transport protein
VVVLLGVAAFPSTALAHSSVESTSPEAGSVVTKSPRQVSITFDQGVTVPNGGVRVLNERAERIGTEKPRTNASPNQINTISVAVPILADGAYVVSWRAVSEDGHPIRGAFTFRVGAAGDQTAVAKLARDLLTNGKTDTALSAGSALVRTLSFGCLLILLGGAAYVLGFRWHLSPNHHRLRSLLLGATAVAGVSGLAAVAFFGPYVAGEGFDALSDGTLLDDTLSSSVGRALLFRTVALVALGLLVMRNLSVYRAGQPFSMSSNGLPGGPKVSVKPEVRAKVIDRSGKARIESGEIATTGLARKQTSLDALALVGLSLAVLWLSTLTGHGSTGRWRALGAFATVTHVGASATWIGLLVIVLVVCSQKPRNGNAPPTVTTTISIVERFSTIAFWSVIVLVVSGLANGFRQIGQLRGITTTNYGRLLLFKVAFVSVLLVLGGLSRRSLAQRRQALAQRALDTVDSGPHVRVDPGLDQDENSQADEPSPSIAESQQRVPAALVALRRRMVVESLLAICVLSITSLLVNAPPSIEVLGKPVSVTMKGTTFLLDTTVSPAQSGRNRIHFYALTPEGQTQAVENMTITAAMPTSDIAPIEVRVVRAGPNHFQALGADLPVKGAWRFTINVQLDTFTAETVATTINIR